MRNPIIILARWLGLISPKPNADANEKIERLEGALLNCPQIPLWVTHRFAPGIYAREMFAPAGTLVIGHEHKRTTLNIMLTGKATVFSDGESRELQAPAIFNSGPGVRKMAVVNEDMRWLTVHATDETDVDKLEDLLIVKSETFLNHEKQLMENTKCLLGQ